MHSPNIKSILKSNKQIFQNLTWLTLFQFANYLIPLILIPYVARLFGKELFGDISYAQNIISYFTLLVNFGFEYSATRKVSIYRENQEKLEMLFWSVMKQKGVLLIIAFLIFLGLYFFSPKVQSDFTLYLFVFLINVGFVLFPNWFLQGLEEMKKMSLFNFLIKFLGLILTFIFVRRMSDYRIYPLILSLSYVFCGAIAFGYVVKHFGLKYRATKTIDKEVFSDSMPVFLNNLFVALYAYSNITVLGMYYPNGDVGIYTGAHKYIFAILMLTSMPINNALYPQISVAFADSFASGKKYFLKVLKIVVPLSLFVSLVTFLSSDMLGFVLGQDFQESVFVFKCLSIMPFLVITASLLTVQGLYGMGLQKISMKIGFIIGVFTVVFNLMFIPRYGIVAVALSWIIAQMLEIIIVGAVLYRKMKGVEI